jgi:hypothetical protein
LIINRIRFEQWIVPLLFSVQKQPKNGPQMAILRPLLPNYYPMKEEVLLEKEEE